MRNEEQCRPTVCYPVGGEETPMSEYLNQLIRTLQAKVDEERAALDRNRAKGLRESKDEGGQLRRTLQRLEILKDLRELEAAKSRKRIRAMGATERKATGPHRASEMRARPARVSSVMS
jgi:uncharacterized protein (DUF2461 family)